MGCNLTFNAVNKLNHKKPNRQLLSSSHYHKSLSITFRDLLGLVFDIGAWVGVSAWGGSILLFGWAVLLGVAVTGSVLLAEVLPGYPVKPDCAYLSKIIKYMLTFQCPLLQHLSSFARRANDNCLWIWSRAEPIIIIGAFPSLSLGHFRPLPWFGIV